MSTKQKESNKTPKSTRGAGEPKLKDFVFGAVLQEPEISLDKLMKMVEGSPFASRNKSTIEVFRGHARVIVRLAKELGWRPPQGPKASPQANPSSSRSKQNSPEPSPSPSENSKQTSETAPPAAAAENPEHDRAL